jgi:DNA-binding transcriptional MerR regulator
MSKQHITLNELSVLSGVEPRTLRSWIKEGLLSPPLRRGRNAEYPASNAERALAIRALKEVYGRSFAEIARELMMASESQIAAWAAEFRLPASRKGSAREYLEQIRPQIPPTRTSLSLDEGAFIASMSIPEPPPFMAKIPPSEERADATHLEQPGERLSDLAGLERLIIALEQVLDAPATRRSRSTTWTRISITSDLELSVRGDLQPRERMLLEQLADQFRAILTGGFKNDRR